MKEKQKKIQNSSTLQRFHQVTPSPFTNLVTCVLFPHVLQHLQGSSNDFFSSENGKGFAGRSCLKKCGHIQIVLKAILPGYIVAVLIAKECEDTDTVKLCAVLGINADYSDAIHINCTIASFFIMFCFPPGLLQALSV